MQGKPLGGQDPGRHLCGLAEHLRGAARCRSATRTASDQHHVIFCRWLILGRTMPSLLEGMPSSNTTRRNSSRPATRSPLGGPFCRKRSRWVMSVLVDGSTRVNHASWCYTYVPYLSCRLTTWTTFSRVDAKRSRGLLAPRPRLGTDARAAAALLCSNALLCGVASACRAKHAIL